MDFIERWLHISPDGGNGLSEMLILFSVVLTLFFVVVAMLRRHLPRNLIEFLEQLGRRQDHDLFDN
jgi:hypothetical protein